MGRVPIEALDCPNGFICLTGQVERARLCNLQVDWEEDYYYDADDLEAEEKELVRKGELAHYYLLAKAEIEVPNGYTSHGTCWWSQTISSCGVGGVGFLSGDANTKTYIEEIEKAELWTLKHMLQILNVDLSNWDEEVERRSRRGEPA